jgi:hypothetical protein
MEYSNIVHINVCFPYFVMHASIFGPLVVLNYILCVIPVLHFLCCHRPHNVKPLRLKSCYLITIDLIFDLTPVFILIELCYCMCYYYKLNINTLYVHMLKSTLTFFPNFIFLAFFCGYIKSISYIM